jgi:hypothetical protein
MVLYARQLTTHTSRIITIIAEDWAWGTNSISVRWQHLRVESDQSPSCCARLNLRMQHLHCHGDFLLVSIQSNHETHLSSLSNAWTSTRIHDEMHFRSREQWGSDNHNENFWSTVTRG